MTSTIINKIVKYAFFAAVLALLTVGTMLSANAQEGTNPIAVKYIGAVGNQPIFQVEFDNLEEEEIAVVLKDTNGNILYTEKFQGKHFSKRFQINRTEEDLNVTLSLTNRKDRQTQQFQINRNLRTIEDVSITRLR
jgi:hypothetical protein